MYEYFVLSIPYKNDTELQSVLDKLMTRTLKWELVTVNRDGQYIFRRPKV